MEATLFDNQTLPADATMAARLRSLAEPLARKIEDGRRPRLENTPKRQREGMSARLGADNLERVQRALLALAEGWERGIVPPELARLKTRTAVEPLVVKRIEPVSYYVIRESEKYQENCELALRLRAFVAEIEGGRHAEQDAAKAQAARLRQLEEDIRFTPIDGFFPTPPALIWRMLELAEIQPGMLCLEPSAGKGDLADAMRAAGGRVYCVERVHRLAEILRAKAHTTDCCDFLDLVPDPQYDRVLMNPPFERMADIGHIVQAFRWLKPGGRLVAITSPSWQHSGRGDAACFRDLLEEQGAHVEQNPADAFKGAFRSTSVQTLTIVIDR